jgi:hypothetical protein
MGVTLGGAFAGFLSEVLHIPVNAPAFAMVGMGAMVGLVISAEAKGLPRPAHIRGVITKEHVADSVAQTVEIYPT